MTLAEATLHRAGGRLEAPNGSLAVPLPEDHENWSGSAGHRINSDGPPRIAAFPGRQSIGER